MPRRTFVVAVFLSLAPAAVTASDAPERPSPEENILRRAGVAVDTDGLLAFFRGRTLTDAESKRVGDLIRRLSADDFDERERASEELRKVGDRAVLLLRAAAHDPDAEIAQRAGRLLQGIKAPAPLPAVAAARLLGCRGPADALPVLLASLPFVGDEAVADEVRAALAARTPDGKADPALAAALDDPSPAKRAAAAYVLARKGDKDQRAAVRKRLEDADAGVRWQAAAGLLAAHDRAAVPALTALLADGPFDTAWRAEEVLRRLAGDRAPGAWLDDSPEGRGKCRDAWAAWWKEKGDGVDLASYEEPERPLGYTLGVEYNTGRVWECDLDGSIRWEIRDLAGPMDAQVLPNDRVLIAEADAHRVTQRDLKGVVKWEKKLDGEPNGCRRLDNGNIFVSTWTAPSVQSDCRAMEYKPDGTLAYSIKLGSGSEHYDAVRKGCDGFIYHVDGWLLSATDTAGQSRCDANGAAAWGVPLPMGEVHYVSLEELPGGRCLVADSRSGRVLEVRTTGEISLPASLTDRQRAEWLDSGLKGGKVLWQAYVPGCCGATRLPNGHTLVGANRKVVELGADGKPVWRKDTEGYVRRVYRR